ncbi:MAG: hypothetical protein LC679_18945 [Intrasporangiaceae bacterium]|nr:hypothetical protein [Intrasporangiaceae bacterium]
MSVRRLTLAVDDPASDHVDAAVHRPARTSPGTVRTSVLLAPGAGGDLDRLRVDHWPHLFAPTLFLQGDRDPFCDLHLLEEHRHKLPRRATVHVVQGGDHSLRVTRAASPTGTASSEAATLAGLGGVLEDWLRRLDETI